MNSLFEKPSSSITINKTFFDYNLSQYRSVLSSKINIAAVVKCNAYGHGLLEVSKLCENSKEINWLCVARLSTAVYLRNHNITKPILVLTHVDVPIQQALKYDIDLTISDIKTAQYINSVGQKLNKKASIHIKVDTGLSRFGFFDYQVAGAIEYIIKDCKNLVINGIYSHCSQSDNADLSYTFEQVMKFNTILLDLKQKGIHIPYQHIANTSATTSVEVNLCNMVRIGAGLYGFWSSDAHRKKTQERFPHFDLKPILTWKSHIIQIKKFPAGSFIGYNKSYCTTKESTLAIVPIGYSDGYDRKLSNKGLVLINNQYAPVVGIVGMNTISVDITHIPSAIIGNEVTLLGDYDHIRPLDLAKLAQSHNPRDIVTRLNPTIERSVTKDLILSKKQFSRYNQGTI